MASLTQGWEISREDQDGREAGDRFQRPHPREAAPIFAVADYGLVGDIFTLVPELTAKL